MKTPHLILVSGPPGAGKSTLAGGIAKELGAVWLDKDCIDEPFSPNERGEFYNQEIEPKVLQALLNLAELNLSANRIVILDVPWTHILINTPAWIGQLYALAQKTDARLTVLECRISEEALKVRMARRGLKRDQAKRTPEGWETFKKRDHLGAANPLPHFVIDAEAPPEACLASALQGLK